MIGGTRGSATLVRWRGTSLFVIASLLAATIPAAAQRSSRTSARPIPEAPRVSAVRTGNVPTHDGLKLVLTADAGTIRVLTDADGQVRYRVTIEAEASDPGASRRLEQFSLSERAIPSGVAITGQMPVAHDADRVWVTYEIHVPRRYNLQISTQAGDVVTKDVDGQVVISTGGGNIQAGNIGVQQRQGGPGSPRHALIARLDTAGGHISVGNVAGSLRASTAGGHITAGNIDGDAVLQTGGGHIRVGRVTGVAQLSTGGGDIVAERADDGATAETGGGRIEFTEAAGTIQARTAGGGVRIGRIAGPAEIDSSDGGILLAGVQAPLHASTQHGTITASFSPLYGSGTPNPAPQATELASVQGDIIVYVPRRLPLTIDALVEQGSDGQIVADPSVPWRVSHDDSDNEHAVHAQCELNGGGRVLHLRTASGNIQLRYLDPNIERRLTAQFATNSNPRTAASNNVAGTANAAVVTRGAAVRQPVAENDADDANALSAFEELRRRFESFWSSAISVAPDEQQRRVVRSFAPDYPDIARQAGVEGDVTLRVVIGKDGAVADVVPISGEPVLARAAVEAVERWRYAPVLVGGRPIGVVTTVTLAFRLR